MKITPKQFILIDLMLSNAIRAAFREAVDLTDEEIDARIKREESRKDELTARLG